MKNRGFAILSTFLLLTCFISCKKGGDPAADGSTKLVKINSDKYYGATLTYNDQNQLTNVAGFINPSTGEQYKYNAQGQVVEILAYYGATEPSSKQFVIHYQNNIPVSGKMKYSPPVSTKDVNPTYYIDSLAYKTTSGNVSEIKFFDRKTYNAKTNALISSRTDTTDKYQINYANGNLTSVKSNNAESTFLYGSKKGVISVHALKFVLNPENNPMLFSSNDLLESIINKSSVNEIKTVYSYTYNNANFPVSGTATRTWKSSTTIENASLDFQYQ
ncbi:MAG: hypothetical protein EOO47_21900 [Flavobacterium sp.]|nr:MAG: hypothetical protein EOO47_21900 [Flavobacterium sp.]